jgi:primary-amine oxidase
MQGSDGKGDDERMYQCFLYMRDPANPTEEDSNHYAFPLPISPVISTETMTVIRVDIIPTGADHTIQELGPVNTERPPNEYISDCVELRQDLKPLHIFQPDGVSFKIVEQPGISTVEWQKWRFEVTFNQREGMVIHNVSVTSFKALVHILSLTGTIRQATAVL